LDPGLKNPGLKQWRNCLVGYNGIIASLDLGLKNPGLKNPGLKNPGLKNPGLIQWRNCLIGYVVYFNGYISI